MKTKMMKKTVSEKHFTKIMSNNHLEWKRKRFRETLLNSL